MLGRLLVILISVDLGMLSLESKLGYLITYNVHVYTLIIYANCVTITAHRRHKKKHKARMRQNASHVENQFCREQKK